MTNQEKVQLFRTIVNEMADLYAKKNENYGNSFGQLFEALGPISGLVPLHNKLDRATNLVRGGKNDFESLEDTFKDLACYAIMNLIEMHGQENKKSEFSAPIEHETDAADYWKTTLWIPCDTCPNNPDNTSNPHVGDSVCVFCSNNPYRLACKGK